MPLDALFPGCTAAKREPPDPTSPARPSHAKPVADLGPGYDARMLRGPELVPFSPKTDWNSAVGIFARVAS